MKKSKTSLFLIGRVLIGLFYLFTGAHHFLDLGSMSAYAEAMGVPLPTVAVLITGALLLTAGITFLVGFKPDLGIAALVVFYIPVSIMMHPFWRMTGESAQPQMINFIKNMALLGSALCFVVLPRPWPLSVDSKLEKARRESTSTAGR